MPYTRTLLLLLMLGCLIGCQSQEETKADQQATATKTSSGDPVKTQAVLDAKAIDKYLSDNGLKAETTERGLRYIIDRKGDGKEKPNLVSRVKVHYEGRLLNGEVFDSSIERGEPIVFPLTNVIKGWQEGIQLLTKGSKATLLIPSGMAYGPKGFPPTIPPNSPLVFSVELIDFE